MEIYFILYIASIVTMLCVSFQQISFTGSRIIIAAAQLMNVFYVILSNNNAQFILSFCFKDIIEESKEQS